MLEPLLHRGPDGRGLIADGPLTLGHRRLAILDLSAAGAQPMESPSGRTVVSFNGEIYNFDDVRRELGLARSELRSGTDTEILLHAWERWGEDVLERLVGQWAFAIYDRGSRRLWLVRDRFGEKPLFFHRSPGVLAFASSLRALLRASFVPRRLDRAALVEYLTLRYVVAPRTVLAGCEKVPPGHLLRVDAQGSAARCWYEPRFRSVRQAASQKQEAELA